jgi:flagellar biosynthetic protein FlhB
MADKGQQTEQPTQRRLQKAREEGQFPVSREFVSGTYFILFTVFLVWSAESWMTSLQSLTAYCLKQAFSPVFGIGEFRAMLGHVIVSNLPGIALFALALASVTVGTQLVSTGFGFAANKITIDVKRLNPGNRLKQLPKQNLPALMQALLLIPLFFGVVYLIVKERYEEFLALPLASVPAGTQRIALAFKSLAYKACLVFFVLGCIDLYRQRRRYTNDLKMSKQEIRDEHKEVEGDPMIKMRIRRIQRDLARKSMMKQVPQATAVITNPTHYAVAIQYKIDSMAAPTVLAKGRNYLAKRIKERAIEANVPIVENPPLAQALYKSVDIGQEIPPHLYRAVAEILAYIFRLMNGRMPGQA